MLDVSYVMNYLTADGLMDAPVKAFRHRFRTRGEGALDGAIACAQRRAARMGRTLLISACYNCNDAATEGLHVVRPDGSVQPVEILPGPSVGRVVYR